MDLTQTYVTFGVQYTRPSEFQHEDEKHPLGMHGNGYAVIEAPSYEIGRAMAFAIFGERFAFAYPAEDWEMKDVPRFYPDGELMRIAWYDGEKLARLARAEAWLAEWDIQGAS